MHRGRGGARLRRQVDLVGSSFGRSRVTVEFNDGVDLDVAASDMRDAVGRVTNQLPDDADPPRIVKADANADAGDAARRDLRHHVGRGHDRSSSRTRSWTRSSAVPGVADVQVYGDRDKIFRVDIDQAKLASLGLTVADMRQRAGDGRVRHAGRLARPPATRTSIVRATADVTTPEEFESIIISGTHPARRRRHGDARRRPRRHVAALRRQDRHRPRHHPRRRNRTRSTSPTGVRRRPSPSIQKTLPKGMSIQVTSDDAVFIDGAIHEVELALGLSVSIVLVVIYLFLLDWRATLIPGLSMPVALIGTIAAIYLAGFSVNILTLLALVLATGLVVDDAIVVLENIVRRRNEGMGPRAAAVLGTQRGVLRRHRHHRDARRRVRAALLPARPDRRAVPRIRLRAGHVGAAVVAWWRCRSARCWPRAC